MAGKPVDRYGVALSGPCAGASDSVEHVLGHGLLVVIAFAEDEEVAGWVIGRCGVADEPGVAKLVDVPIPVDAHVIRDVDPPF